MDRDRLEQGVKQQDISEAKVNQDFIDWLKTAGPTWLLVILVGIVSYVGIVRWRQSQANHRNLAWQALLDLGQSNAGQPGAPTAYEEVAAEYEDVDGLGVIARLLAAERHMNAVQTNRPLLAPVTSTEPMTADQREAALSAAERLYREILTIANAKYPDRGGDLHRAAAYFGQAAIAEARGNVDQAKGLYEQVISGPGTNYPQIMAQAENRLADVEEIVQPVELSDKDLTAPISTPIPPVIDPVIRDIVNGPPPGADDADETEQVSDAAGE